MKSVKLIQRFNGYEIDETIEVEDKIARDLINQKIAINTKTKDYLVKSNMGKTKAFKSSPKIKKYEK